MDQASKTKETGSKYLEITSENTANHQLTLSSVHRNILHCWYFGKQPKVPCMMSQPKGIPQKLPEFSENFWSKEEDSGVGTQDLLPRAHMVNH